MNKTELDMMKSMIDILNLASERYYNSGEIIMSDAQFDQRLEDLRQLEEETGLVLSNSPTINVGAKVLTELKEVKHNHPMLSLEKCHSVEEIIKFANNKELVASIKLDGLTISLLYEDGVFISAETRGDGASGSDVTEHVKQFLNVPMNIGKKGIYIIDGEAIIVDNDFAEINKNGEYKNSRNLAAGTLSVLDTSLVKERKLSFFAWDIIEGGNSEKLFDNLKEANELGFGVVPFWGVIEQASSSIYESVINVVFTYAKENGLPNDGVVLKFNDIEYGKSLGKTSHHFKNGIAYKRKDEEAETILRKIEWQLGKSEVLTPVAIFDEVELSGSTVSRATVHNVEILTKLDLHVGDKITIYKANDIIPAIRENLSAKKHDGRYIEIPSKCPVCGGHTEIHSPNLICTNPNCKGKLLGKLKHFVSKSAMDINGLSEATLEKFIDERFICKFADIYELETLHFGDIANLEGFGINSTNKLMNSIENSKHTTLDRFINALSIPMVGKENAKLIAKYCNYDIDTFLNLLSIRVYEWWLIDGIGSVVSDNINNFAIDNIDEVKELVKYLNFYTHKVSSSVDLLKNKVFCITGSLEHFTNRDELKNRIEEFGGKVSGSISSKTDYLICNEASNSSKYNKAQSLGVKVITEDEFLNMLK